MKAIDHSLLHSGAAEISLSRRPTIVKAAAARLDPTNWHICGAQTAITADYQRFEAFPSHHVTNTTLITVCFEGSEWA